MREKSFYKIQAVVISLILIFQVFIPILSMADDSKPSITVQKHREDNKVTLTITDTKAKIKDVRIVYGEKITDHKYFHDEEGNLIEGKGEKLEFTTSSEEEGNNQYTVTFDIQENYSEYTVFILDDNRNSFLYNYTITPSSANEMTMSVTKSEVNPRDLTIKVTSAESDIKTLKIAKVSSKEEKFDFKTNGTTIDITQQQDKKNIELQHTVADDGIYKVYAENDSGSSYTYTVIVSQGEQIKIEYKQNETQKNQLEINVSDTVANITSVKIAKYEVDKEPDWDNAKELHSNNESKLESLTYTIPESGKYSIKVTDAAGMSFTRTTSRLYINDESKPEIKVSINKSNPKVVNIVATDNMSKIKELYVSEDESLSTIEDIKEKAEKLSITSSNKVEVAYEVKDAETLYMYAISEDGQAFMLEAKISEIEVIDDNQPEVQDPDNNQPEVQDPDNDQPEVQDPDNNQPEVQDPDNDQPEVQDPDNDQPEVQDPDNDQPEVQEPNNNNQELIKPEKPEEQESSNNNQELIKPEEPEEPEPEYSYPIEDNDDDEYSYDNETNSNYNQNYDEVEEYEDSTISNDPLPQTGVKNGIVTVMMILMVNAIIALRKYSKIR